MLCKTSSFAVVPSRFFTSIVVLMLALLQQTYAAQSQNRVEQFILPILTVIAHQTPPGFENHGSKKTLSRIARDALGRPPMASHTRGCRLGEIPFFGLKARSNKTAV